MSINVYQMVTDRIVEELQKGVIPWRKPWVGSLNGAINYVTRAPYHGVNTLLLSKPGEYLTFKQIEAKKGLVKKGAKGHFVVYFQMCDVKKKYKCDIVDAYAPRQSTLLTKINSGSVTRFA